MIRRLLLLLVTVSVVLSCDRMCDFEEFHDMSVGGWRSDEPLYFHYPNDDTNSTFSLDVVVETEQLPVTDTLGMEIEVISPDGKKVFFERRVLFGGGVRFRDGEIIVPVVRSARFPVKGTYLIAVRRAEDADVFGNIKAVGVILR